MIGMNIEVLADPAPDGMKAAHRRGMRIANFEGMEFWRQNYLPLHFRRGNRTRYNHTPRSKRTKEKKRRLGVRIDNVETGEARQIAVRPRRARATGSKAILTIPGPFYFRITAKGRVNMAEETLTVRPDELKEITAHAGAEYEEHLNQVRRPSRRRV